MVDHTYKIKTSKDDKNLEYVLNGMNKEKINNDEKAKKLSQTETEHADLYESITNRRMSRFMPSRKENMQNNKLVSFSSIVE
jgi:hypothetical protein